MAGCALSYARPALRPAVIDPKLTPRRIVEALDRYVIGQDDAKRIVAVAVYAHFRKVARAAQRDASIAKSNVLLIGPTGTGKTLLCETLSRILGVPFVTAEATSPETVQAARKAPARSPRTYPRSTAEASPASPVPPRSSAE